MLPGDSLFIVLLPAILVAYLYGVLRAELPASGRGDLRSGFLQGSLFSFFLAFIFVFLVTASSYYLGIGWLRQLPGPGKIFTVSEGETIAKGYASGILFITGVIGLLLVRRSGVRSMKVNLFCLASTFHSLILSILLIIDAKILSADVRQHGYGQYGLTDIVAALIAAGSIVLVILSVKAFRDRVRVYRLNVIPKL